MKKFLLLLVSLSAAGATMSQAALEGSFRDIVAVPRLHLGITGGVSFAKITEKYSGFTIVTSGVTAPRGGLMLDYRLTNGIYFQPRALLCGKGGRLTLLGVESALLPYYLEVPLDFVYKLPAGPGRVFAGLGPYAAIGLFGQFRTKRSSPAVSRHLRFGSGKDDDLRSADFGGDFLLGYELRAGCLLSLNYSQGLYNIIPRAKEGQQTAENHYFGISVGYLLRKL